MFSSSTIDTLQAIRRVSAENALALVSSSLVETGERVVVIAVMSNAGTRVALTPLAMLKPTSASYLNQDGTVADAAVLTFAEIRRHLNSNESQAWFTEDENGRLQVGFAKHGSRGNPADTLLTLPWGDPCTLFAAPIRDPDAPGTPRPLPAANRVNSWLH
jgi:hypothetical protein